MKFLKTKKGIALLVTLVVAGLAAVAAYSYFSNTGQKDATPVIVQTVPMTGSFAITVGQIFYEPDGTATGLIPTVRDDPNEVIGDVMFTVANTTEADEAIHDYSVGIVNPDGSAWSSQTDPSKPACTKDDFSISNGPVGVDFVADPDPAVNPEFPVLLKPASDAPANQWQSGFSIQMIENNSIQDNCMGVKPPVQIKVW